MASAISMFTFDEGRMEKAAPEVSIPLSFQVSRAWSPPHSMKKSTIPCWPKLCHMVTFIWERRWSDAVFTTAMLSFSEAHSGVQWPAPWLSEAVGSEGDVSWVWLFSVLLSKGICLLHPCISLPGRLQVPSGVQIPLFSNIYRDRAPWWANSTIWFCELFLQTQPIACSCRPRWFCKHLITSFKCLSVYNS